MKTSPASQRASDGSSWPQCSLRARQARRDHAGSERCKTRRRHDGHIIIESGHIQHHNKSASGSGIDELTLAPTLPPFHLEHLQAREDARERRKAYADHDAHDADNARCGCLFPTRQQTMRNKVGPMYHVPTTPHGTRIKRTGKPTITRRLTNAKQTIQEPRLKLADRNYLLPGGQGDFDWIEPVNTAGTSTVRY